MTDYPLSKLFYDLHNDPKLAAEYRADMAGFLDRYDISPAMRDAVMADDVGAIAPHVNAYLLRVLFPGARHAAAGIHGAAQRARRQGQAAAEGGRPWLASSASSRRATVRSSRGTGRSCRRATARS